MTKTINSKRKGKEGELRLVHFLREQGYECRRAAQYCGKTGEAAPHPKQKYCHKSIANSVENSPI